MPQGEVLLVSEVTATGCPWSHHGRCQLPTAGDTWGPKPGCSLQTWAEPRADWGERGRDGSGSCCRQPTTGQAGVQAGPPGPPVPSAARAGPSQPLVHPFLPVSAAPGPQVRGGGLQVEAAAVDRE